VHRATEMVGVLTLTLLCVLLLDVPTRDTDYPLNAVCQ
jgi:hypothetical protein